MQTAAEHIIITTGLGHDNSIKKLSELYYTKRSIKNKEELAAARLRAHQAAVDATKSP